MRQSAPARYAVKRTRKKAVRVLWALVQTSPRTLGEICPNGQILAPAAFNWGPRRSPAERVRWGEEEQGSGRSFRRKAETELSGLCDDEDRARPAKVSREAARRPSGGFSLFGATENRGPRRSPAKRVRWGEDCARRRVSEANRPKGGS